MMNELKMWLKVIGLVLLKSFTNYVWIKLIFIIIMFIEELIVGKHLGYDGYRAICLGIGIYMAINTTYHVDGNKCRVWSKEWRWDFKEENKDETE